MEMNHKFILISTIITLLMTACSYKTKPVLLDDSVEDVELKKWEKYGAVYLYDEHFIEQTIHQFLAEKNVVQYQIIHKKLKILTKEGLQHATFNISNPRAKFKIIHKDSLGNEIPVDIWALRKQARKTGKVAVPQAQVGSTIEFRVRYTSQSPFTQFELWFNKEIPVLHSKYTFSTHSDYTYDIKTYGSAGKPLEVESTEHESVTYRIWENYNILPASNVKTLSWDNSKLPRVGVSLLNFNWINTTKTWTELASEFKSALYNEGFFSSQRDFNKLVDSIGQNKRSMELAQALLQYIQDNITLKNKGMNQLDLDEILEEKAASRWEMAVLLQKMFEQAGLLSDVVVTRDKRSGGFDPDFTNTLQTEVPLVVVEVDGVDYLCFPYMRGARVGEFPIWFNNLKGLFLSGEVDMLPKNILKGNMSHTVQILDLEDLEEPIAWEVKLAGYRGLYHRNYFIENTPEDNLEKMQDFIGGFSKRNSISEKLEYTQSTLYQDTLSLKFEAKNGDLLIERKGEQLVSFGKLFKNFYKNLSEKGERMIEEAEADVWVEEVVLKNYKESSELVYHCEELNNFFVKVECSQTPGAEGLTLQRTIKFKKGIYTPAQFKRIQSFVESMNKIKESYLVQ